MKYGETWWNMVKHGENNMVKLTYFTIFHHIKKNLATSNLQPLLAWKLSGLAVNLLRVPLWEGCLASSSFGASGKGLSQQEMPKAMKAMKAMKSSSCKAMKAVKKPLQKGNKTMKSTPARGSKTAPLKKGNLKKVGPTHPQGQNEKKIAEEQ